MIKLIWRWLRTIRQNFNRLVGGFRENWRYRLYRSQGYKLGEMVRIGPHVMLGGKVSIGDHTMIVGNARIQGDVEIGSNVVIAPNCTILGVNHDFDQCNALPYGTDYIVRKIVIEKNAWLGMHVKILGGAYIEEGAIIGMGSVVTGRIPAGAVAVGVPARVLKFRNMERYHRLCKEQKFIGKIRRRFPNQSRNIRNNLQNFNRLLASRGFMLDFEISSVDNHWQASTLYQLAVSHKMLFGSAGPFFVALRPDCLPRIESSIQEILNVIHQHPDSVGVDADMLLADFQDLRGAIRDSEKIISGKDDYQSWFLPPIL